MTHNFDFYTVDDLVPTNYLVRGCSLEQYEQINQEYLQMMKLYSHILEEMDMRLLQLKRHLDHTQNHTVIRDIHSRLKSAESMTEKIRRLKKPCTIESIQKNLFDIAGIRIICSYLFDIYNVLSWIQSQKDLKITQVKDYIKHPKKSGYRSVHVIFSLTIDADGEKQEVFCEIQLRTAAMDSWAALEHQLQYKTGRTLTRETAFELCQCAALLYKTDQKMQDIFNYNS